MSTEFCCWSLSLALIALKNCHNKPVMHPFLVAFCVWQLQSNLFTGCHKRMKANLNNFSHPWVPFTCLYNMASAMRPVVKQFEPDNKKILKSPMFLQYCHIQVTPTSAFWAIYKPYCWKVCSTGNFPLYYQASLASHIRLITIYWQ